MRTRSNGSTAFPGEYKVTQLRAGFAGLGAMGRGMARNLHKAGLLQAVWNRTTGRAHELAAELQASASADLAALARDCDVVVLCVSADADVLAVVDGLLPGLRPGALVIDCSTVSADTAREAARRVASRDAAFLDAPVSGGVEGARDGTLAIMVGGPADAFERAQPVLQAMGRTVTHFGANGAGQAAKATNQIMCAGVIQAVAEAMAFAKAQGLPLPQLIETLGKGAGSSWYFVHRAPNIVRDAYPAGFRVRLHEKDLRICHDMAARFGVQLPVVETTLAQYAELVAQGHGDEDISVLFRLKDALFAAGGGADATREA
ncbi:MAG TPA: NAD(P)-dependent oxidoreductase [Steroidobacteraceae bacterium]|nr:NAD(P)-dependent oxidoreductase [Steroidobacteraceae bacterium]